jgi:hypothetical protein
MGDTFTWIPILQKWFFVNAKIVKLSIEEFWIKINNLRIPEKILAKIFF